MRRTLVLMRHGEAEEAARGGDRFRVLTDAGKKAAAATAKALVAKGVKPEKAFASDAARTRETSEQTGLAFEFRSELYLTGLTHIRKVVEPVSVDCATVMLIGHNPGFSEAATVLSSQYVALRPADAAVLATDADSWAEALGCVGIWELAGVIQGAADWD